MRLLFAGLVAVHGLIHLIGVAKAFGFGEIPQLSQPISRPIGLVWLGAAVAMGITAATVVWSPRLWWLAAAVAVAISQAVIITSWTDARFGTVANVVVLIGALYGFASQGPLSFRAEYRREVQQRASYARVVPTVTEADLVSLPRPLQEYLRISGAVGQPRVDEFTATWRGRIRAAPDEPWMSFTARQHNYVNEPARFFLMDARRSGVPVDVFHQFIGDAATMRVRVLSLVPVVRAFGADLDRAETVTLFQELCVLAPAALIDPEIRWDSVDALTVRGHYTVGSNTISALLFFNTERELVNFVSEDRLAASSDGTRFLRQRWSTPLSNYQILAGHRVSTHGEGVWHPPEGEFVYIELDLLELSVNSPN